jgi:hypothetical protein
MELKTTDLTDPALLIEREWGYAIEEWLKRRPERLAELLRNTDGQIPEFAREFLADLVAGKVSRGKGGRPNGRDPWVELAIMAEVFREWETAEGSPHLQGESPRAAACALVASRRGITEDAVRGIVDRRRKHKFTLDNWKSWGRPDWRRT